MRLTPFLLTALALVLLAGCSQQSSSTSAPAAA
jgi:uncharacterized lipoprotein YajG